MKRAMQRAVQVHVDFFMPNVVNTERDGRTSCERFFCNQEFGRRLRRTEGRLTRNQQEASSPRQQAPGNQKDSLRGVFGPITVCAVLQEYKQGQDGSGGSLTLNNPIGSIVSVRVNQNRTNCPVLCKGIVQIAILTSVEIPLVVKHDDKDPL